MQTTIGSATYSPEDNKIRIYPAERLPGDIYSRLRAEGFIWAPKQELFVAPMWTPDRADLAEELCGPLEDEAQSLEERARQRAERFRDYSDKRLDDAESAREAVAAIADNIPLGQPILIGHHSERHARKDAERIENGMRRAVKMWETSQYWKDRAAGAIAAARYKERPDVRARRIKGLEADKRKAERNKAEAEHVTRFWNGQCLLTNKATGEKRPLVISEENKEVLHRVLGTSSILCHSVAVPGKDGTCNYDAQDIFRPGPDRYTNCPELTVEQVKEIALARAGRAIARAARWIEHLSNRIEYERAMLEADGAEDLLKPAPRVKQLPLCNYRQSVISCQSPYHREPMQLAQIEMTSEEYAAINKDYKGTRTVDNSHRIRTCMSRHTLNAVFLTDSKVHEKPAPGKPIEDTRPTRPAAPAYTPPPRTAFDDMRDSLKSGVQVVTAPQLFPTPPALARQMTDAAGLLAGRTILEPSAGTGNIVSAIFNAATGADCCRVTAVEINPRLASMLEEQRNKTLFANGSNYKIVCADFLECNGDLGMFDCVLMNPPFERGSDIKHIKHALQFLKPGGRLVAICANGPRQREELMPLVEASGGTWEALPDDTFKEQGTSVRTALLVIHK